MARIGFALPIHLERPLAADALRYGHEVVARTTGADELVALLEHERPDAVVVMSDPRYLSSALLVACDERGVRVLALVADDPARRHLAHLGVKETVEASADWARLEPLLFTTPSPPTGPRDPGTVIAVWGPGGAPGRTSVAIALAAELAALGHSVALADVDTHGASVAPALGMLDDTPGFAAACRLAGSASLTFGELERIAERYESENGSFWVLTGLGRPSRWPELTGERVSGTIAQLRRWVDVTVLDTSSSLDTEEDISSDLLVPRRNASTLTAVREADYVVAVGAADPVGVSRLLRSHVEVREVARGDITVVMNRVRASAIGMNPGAQLSQTLSRFGGIESPVLVPHDLPAYDRALLAGRTLVDVSPRSPARMALRGLALRLAPTPVPASPPQDRHRRRRGER